MLLTLDPGVLEQILEDAQSRFPNEGCGLLTGRGNATRFISVRNISDSPKEFEMDPAELIHALRDARNTGDRLLAIYHSHPHGPAKPSERDIERAYYPDAAHLIVSLQDLKRPQAVAFRIVDGEAVEIELHAIV